MRNEIVANITKHIRNVPKNGTLIMKKKNYMIKANRLNSIIKLRPSSRTRHFAWNKLNDLIFLFKMAPWTRPSWLQAPCITFQNKLNSYTASGQGQEQSAWKVELRPSWQQKYMGEHSMPRCDRFCMVWIILWQTLQTKFFALVYSNSRQNSTMWSYHWYPNYRPSVFSPSQPCNLPRLCKSHIN